MNYRTIAKIDETKINVCKLHKPYFYLVSFCHCYLNSFKVK